MTQSQSETRPTLTQVLHNDKGPILLEGPTSGEKLGNYSIDEGLRAFRPAWRQKEALVDISQEDGWVVSAVNQNTIVGYVTFHPPGEFERWGKTGRPEILELGAIEVAPGFRNIKLGKEMMKLAFSDPVVENFIIISTEYYWHWDLDGTRLGIWDYQQVMTKLMESVGMVKRDTDEQEICAHPANMLMVRIGSAVCPEAVQTFEKLLIVGKQQGGTTHKHRQNY